MRYSMIMELDHSPITEYFAIRVSFILLLWIDMNLTFGCHRISINVVYKFFQGVMIFFSVCNVL